jgi:mRNA-degrading endonuclease RelE of RelBE toxin-antitoxin system
MLLIMAEKYSVSWSRTAVQSLARLFNINHKLVFNKSEIILSFEPRIKAFGVSDSPGYELNGYYWILINNVVLIYRVSDEQKRVFIDACYFANTKETAQIFWGIEPDKD